MALSAGGRLGPYEILSALGVGGMGEVYRARDTKLDREVAIKVLPEQFVADPERVARFQREAKTLAALNHPHIGGIYGLEDADGVRALVLELVEGPTLADRIAQCPIPLDEALPIARQIAEALEAAHEAGIIHRDLKPANIKVRTDGTVKVLDFGLAKALDTITASNPSVTQSPTITSPAMMTGVGMILGTAAYMSPEQARGKTVDRRADIWAFGVILFEMLTGRRAFDGEDVSVTLASVLKTDPDWNVLPVNTPLPIRTLLRRCLQKDLQKRLPQIGVARIEIEDGAANAEPVMNPASPVRSWLRAFPWAIAAMAVAVAVGLTFRSAPTVATRPVTRFPIALPPDTTLAIGPNQSQLVVALSPDGSRLVYVANRGSGESQLYVRSIDHVEPQPLRATEGARVPFFSPDGQWIGFSTADGKLKKVSVTGGATLTIGDLAGAGLFGGATWLPDDSIIFGMPNGILYRVSSAGGKPTEWAKPTRPSELMLRWPEVLPGGGALLLTILQPGTDFSSAAIAVMRLDTGERRVLLAGGTMPHYLPSGHLVFARAGSGSVFVVPFDLRTLQVTGTPVSMIDDVLTNVTQGTVELALSRTGSIVYVPGKVADDSQTLVWVDRHGQVEPTNAPPRNYAALRLSPDGRRLAASIGSSGAAGLRDIWLYEFSRGMLSRLTAEKEEAETPAWTPDGTRVTYAVSRSPGREFRWKLADGSGGEEALAGNDRQHLHLGSWSPSGDALVAEATNNGADAGSLWMLEMTPKPTLRLFLKTPSHLQAPAISPDGRWIAYSANDTNRFEVYVQSFPRLGRKDRISTAGGTEPRWARNGRELFFWSGDKMMTVTVGNQGDHLDIGQPTALFEGRFAASYDVSPDGRFLMIKPADTQSTGAMIMVQDWINELKARVPTK